MLRNDLRLQLVLGQRRARMTQLMVEEVEATWTCLARCVSLLLRSMQVSSNPQCDLQTVPELKELCRERGLPVSGTKAVLLERLQG